MSGGSVRARAGFALACTALALCLACNEQRPPPPAARFDRPNRVAFLCADDDDFTPLPAERCRFYDEDDPTSMYALVTQAGRGEIAAVNLRRRRVLDARREIPGFTYQPVGEAPSAVVVPAQHASHTYVASFGSRDLRVLRSRTLIATVDEKPLAQSVELVDPASGERVAPTTMVITPDERALVLGIPDAGRLLVLPLVRCASGATDCEDGLVDEDAIRSVDLSTSTSRVAAPPAIEPARYEKLCGYERPELPRVHPVTLAPDALTAVPRPSALAVDAFCEPGQTCAPRILVADDALPIVHVVDAAALVAGGDPLLAPLVTGVPTAGIAVTPHVPREVGNEDAGSTQYVYAIDSLHGSVLVLEQGVLLDVNADATLPSDRIGLGAGRSPTRAIAVLTPSFDPTLPPHQYVGPSVPDDSNVLSDLACTDGQHPDVEGARLRGVFLAAATSDGAIHIVDIHDMELSGKDGAPACRPCAEGDGPIPAVVRHQRRLAETFLPRAGERPPPFTPEVSALRFQVDRSSFDVRADGTTASPSAPGLECMQCSDGRVRVYPTIEPAEAVDGGVADAGSDAGLDAGMDAGAAPDAAVAEPAPLGDAAVDAAVTGEDEVVVSTCPANNPALVCAPDDPWLTPQEAFAAVFEGNLPGTAAARGRFVLPESAENVSGGLELFTDLDACSLGVLGEEDIAPDYEGCDAPPSATDFKALDGDQVVLVSKPLGRTGLIERLGAGGATDDVIERCAALRTALDDDDFPARVGFEIRRAYADRLVVSDLLVQPIGKIRTFEQLAACYESPVSFQITTYRAFTVTGGGTGFAHRVRANAAGRCQIDPAGDPLNRGRARLGCTFRNHSLDLRFAVKASDPSRLPPVGTRLEVRVDSRAAKLSFDGRQVGFDNATVIATDLAFNPIDEGLYLVDISERGRGLLPIGLDPFPPFLSTSYQYR